LFLNDQVGDSVSLTSIMIEFSNSR